MEIYCQNKNRLKELDNWNSFCSDHPGFQVAKTCLDNVTSEKFWSLADQFSDLVSRFHVQIRLMSNLGLCGMVPWLLNTDGAMRFICKGDVEDIGHSFFDCFAFKEDFDSVWSNLKLKILNSNLVDGIHISNFISALAHQEKILLLLGGLVLPFDQDTTTLINRFLFSAVGKVYCHRKEILSELGAPWLTK